MALESGQTIGGRYQLRRKLGSGGMADVWLAHDASSTARWRSSSSTSASPRTRQFVERFRREAQAAAGLQHPNVVGVYDRGEDDGPPLDRDGVRRGGDRSRT